VLVFAEPTPAIPRTWTRARSFLST
jgi:hypothetical protein